MQKNFNIFLNKIEEEYVIPIGQLL